MAPPIRETIEDDVKALIYEELIQAAEIGVERVSLLHHLYESITQLTTRHVKRNNVGPIQIAVRLAVEPSFSLQAIVKRRRGNRMQLPNQRIGDGCIVNETRDSLEGRHVVVVEADDHTA